MILGRNKRRVLSKGSEGYESCHYSLFVAPASVSSTTTKMVDVLLATTLDLVNIKHFKTGLQAAVTTYKPGDNMLYRSSVYFNESIIGW